MKKTIETKIPELTTIQTIFKCDFCGMESSVMKQCHICGRDACYRCSNADEDDYSDYPDVYCKDCHKLKFVDYKEERQRIKDECEDRLNNIDKKIKKIILNNKK